MKQDKGTVNVSWSDHMRDIFGKMLHCVHNLVTSFVSHLVLFTVSLSKLPAGAGDDTP